MTDLDFSTLVIVCGWSLAAVAGGLICGFLLGRLFTLQCETRKLRINRQSLLSSLVKLLQSTDQLNQDVDQHHSALTFAKQEIESIKAKDHEQLQSELVLNIAKVMQANRKLEHDLVISKFQLQLRAQELDQTKAEARTDSLCQVGNRKAVDERLEFMISRMRKEEHSFGLMLIDVDHFKRINDTFGHQAGDEVLTSIAETLRQCVRPGDFVGRLGGDEFIILLDGLTVENAKSVGARIRGSIERSDFSVDDQGQSTVVTLSMGLAVVNPNDTPATLYERADKALYRSKELGRNRLCTILEDDQTSPALVEPNDAPVPSYEAIKASIYARQAR